MLTLRPVFSVAGSGTFMRKNTRRTVDERFEELPRRAKRCQKLGMDWIKTEVTAAFGCNYSRLPLRHLIEIGRTKRNIPALFVPAFSGTQRAPDAPASSSRT